MSSPLKLAATANSIPMSPMKFAPARAAHLGPDPRRQRQRSAYSPQPLRLPPQPGRCRTPHLAPANPTRKPANPQTHPRRKRTANRLNQNTPGLLTRGVGLKTKFKKPINMRLCNTIFNLFPAKAKSDQQTAESNPL